MPDAIVSEQTCSLASTSTGSKISNICTPYGYRRMSSCGRRKIKSSRWCSGYRWYRAEFLIAWTTCIHQHNQNEVFIKRKSISSLTSTQTQSGQRIATLQNGQNGINVSDQSWHSLWHRWVPGSSNSNASQLGCKA